MNQNESEIKNLLMQAREYYSNPIAEKRLELFARALERSGVSIAGLKDAIAYILKNNKTFPSLAELIEMGNKYTINNNSDDGIDCNMCHSGGIVIVRMPSFHSDVAFRCQCENGNKFQNLTTYRSQRPLSIWNSGGYKQLYGEIPA